MSEVLSGPEAGSATRSDRFTIFPADERQSLRLGRFLMAALTRPHADKALYQAKAAGRNRVTALG